MECVRTSAGSPWQNGHVERLIGSIRRECLDHTIVIDERHLERLLGSYRAYYNRTRPHLSLRRDAPNGRSVQSAGEVYVTAEVGGLHHRYDRQAA
jgi:putative transposase